MQQQQNTMSSLNRAILLLLLIGLVTRTSCALSLPPYNPGLCVIVPAKLQPCAEILRAGRLTGPVPLRCCAALKRTKLAIPIFGVRTTCLCAHLSLGDNGTPPSPSPPPPTAPIPNPPPSPSPPPPITPIPSPPLSPSPTVPDTPIPSPAPSPSPTVPTTPIPSPTPSPNPGPNPAPSPSPTVPTTPSPSPSGSATFEDNEAVVSISTQIQAACFAYVGFDVSPTAPCP